MLSWNCPRQFTVGLHCLEKRNIHTAACGASDNPVNQMVLQCKRLHAATYTIYILEWNKRLLSKTLSVWVRRTSVVWPSSRCTLKPKSSSLSTSKKPWKLGNILQHDTSMTQHDQKVHAVSWYPYKELFQSHALARFFSIYPALNVQPWTHGHYQGRNSALADEWWTARLHVGALVANEDLSSRLDIISRQNTSVHWKALWTNKNSQKRREK